MRIGGPFFSHVDSPEAWITMLREKGYTASCCPITEQAEPDTVESYRVTALKENVLICEVDAITDDICTEAGKQAIIKKLRLAEGVGALCCVSSANGNVDADKLADAIKDVLSEVRPIRTFFTLQMDGKHYPKKASDFIELMKAVDHPRLGVCLDLCNGLDYRDCFLNLAPFIRTITIDESHMEDDKLVEAIHNINPDMCVMLPRGVEISSCARERLYELGYDT